MNNKEIAKYLRLIADEVEGLVEEPEHGHSVADPGHSHNAHHSARGRKFPGSAIVQSAIAQSVFADEPAERPDPAEFLAMENDRGYSLQQCLFAMLKRWDENDPTWSVEGGIQRQAKGFKLPISTVHEAIRSSTSLHRRFAVYPASGYPYAIKTRD